MNVAWRIYNPILTSFNWKCYAQRFLILSEKRIWLRKGNMQSKSHLSSHLMYVVWLHSWDRNFTLRVHSYVFTSSSSGNWMNKHLINFSLNKYERWWKRKLRVRNWRWFLMKFCCYHRKIFDNLKYIKRVSIRS